MALPIGVIDATAPDWIAQVASLVREHEPMELVIGNPVSLRGRDEIASESVRARALDIAAALPALPVRLVDERLTTASAMRQLLETGRSTKDARRVIDVHAAIGILEFALEYERRTGQAPGEAL